MNTLFFPNREKHVVFIDENAMCVSEVKNSDQIVSYFQVDREPTKEQKEEDLKYG
jgi:hypothetical protein